MRARPLQKFFRTLATQTCKEKPTNPITKGPLFDPQVIYQIAQQFDKDIKSFGGLFSARSAVLRVSGFGMLQKYLSVRDAQVVESGMINYIKKHQIPKRLLNPAFDAGFHSCLGYDYYFDYDGNPTTVQKFQLVAPTNVQEEMQVFDMLVSNKNKSISQLVECASDNTSILKGLFSFSR